jgi:hypothetical protein
MFTPSYPNTATYKSYRYCLAIRMLPNRQREFSNNTHQIVSDNLAISFRQTKSKDLAIKEAKSLAIKVTLRNAGDVMLTSSSQRQGIHIVYSTLPTKNLLKTTYTVQTRL